ncbi:MAG TPA: hypothetical protein VN277_08570, partial [Acidiferrobacterales bacterium]|nr:hypothetical protein [Acidiferrobacterales bacterium]
MNALKPFTPFGGLANTGSALNIRVYLRLTAFSRFIHKPFRLPGRESYKRDRMVFFVRQAHVHIGNPIGLHEFGGLVGKRELRFAGGIVRNADVVQHETVAEAGAHS